MRTLCRHALALILLIGPATSLAQEGKEPIVTPPPPPEALLPQADGIEPKVSIITRDWATIEEYSVGGQVYAVKITPSVGPAYYLYDSYGDGSLETRTDVNPDMPELNRWRILTW
jgi:hypothetical protein